MDSLFHKEKTSTTTQNNHPPVTHIYIGTEALIEKIKEKDEGIQKYNQKLEQEIAALHLKVEQNSKGRIPDAARQELIAAHSKEENTIHHIHDEIKAYLKKKNKEILNQIERIVASKS